MRNVHQTQVNGYIENKYLHGLLEDYARMKQASFKLLWERIIASGKVSAKQFNADRAEGYWPKHRPNLP